jgi:hypothetical protein
MPTRRPATPHPPQERSYWELLPRRNFRRVLFLIAVLLAVLALKRAGGGAFRNLFEGVAPPPRPYQRLQVAPAPARPPAGPPHDPPHAPE